MFSLITAWRPGALRRSLGTGWLQGGLVLLPILAIALPAQGEAGDLAFSTPSLAPQLEELAPRYVRATPPLLPEMEKVSDAGVDVVPLPASIGGAGVVLVGLWLRRTLRRR